MNLPKKFEKDYEINDGQITYKKDYKFKSSRIDKDITIPKEHIIVYDTKEKDTIKNLTKQVSHSYLLHLKEIHSIKFGEYEIIADPTDNEEKRGYVRVCIEDSDVIGDGEVLVDCLPTDFQQYAFTIMFKRAEDRAIAKYLGLYSEGFLTESEILPSNTEKVQYDDLEIGKVTDDKTFDDKNDNNNVNKESDTTELILLLLKLLKVDTTGFQQDILEETGKDNLYDCTDKQKSDLLGFYEGQFDSDNQLSDVLLDYVKEYKVINTWGQDQFKDEITNTLKTEVSFDDLTIDNLYDLILFWKPQ